MEHTSLIFSMTAREYFLPSTSSHVSTMGMRVAWVGPECFADEMSPGGSDGTLFLPFRVLNTRATGWGAAPTGAAAAVESMVGMNFPLSSLFLLLGWERTTVSLLLFVRYFLTFLTRIEHHQVSETGLAFDAFLARCLAFLCVLRAVF